MSENTWETVDTFFSKRLHGADPVLEAVLSASDAAGLPAIAVAPNQGAFLNILARAIGARRILEVGTLGGYSTVWMARALPEGGQLVTIEVDQKHAEVARKNFALAGLSDVIELRLGRAADLLPKIAEEGGEPFDLAFIDADKPGNPVYFDWALKLSRPGSIIVVDNVVRSGAVADSQSTDLNVKGIHTLAARLAGEKRVRATVIQTVGVKGYDGLAIAVVL